MKITKIKTNPNNPRFIKDEQFAKLVKSIKAFPKMMELRPIVVDHNWVIVGGNMRYKALLELDYKEIPDEWVKQAKDFSEDELKEFIIKDNLGFGEWDWDMIANEWNEDELNEWGLDTPMNNIQVPGFDEVDKVKKETQELLEISDEEINEAAEMNCEDEQSKTDWILGAKWYKEELFNRYCAV